MSYEGFIQALCEKGHYNQFEDRMDFDPEAYGSCRICKSKIAWVNSVDDTNGDAWGFIPPDLFNAFLSSFEKVETCNLGHQHITSHATYDQPSAEERDAVRSYHTVDGAGWRICNPVKRLRELRATLQERGHDHSDLMLSTSKA